jgi:hypothetical protein
MRSPKPPALATWLVEHSKTGGKNEALSGDLLEQFSQGRSVSWYWRQAIVAMLLGVAKEWLILAWASVVTVGWAIDVNAARFWNTPWTRPLFGMGTDRSWLGSLIFATGAFTTHALLRLFWALGLYLTMKTLSNGLPAGWPLRSLSRRLWEALWRPLGVGYLVVSLSTFLLLALLPARRHPIIVGNVVALLPVFLGLIVMMWCAPSNGPTRWTLKFFRIDPPSNW